MNNPSFLNKDVDPGYLLWLEEFYPLYYECAMKNEYSVIPGKMYIEYLEEINKKYGMDLYSKRLEELRAH